MISSLVRQDQENNQNYIDLCDEKHILKLFAVVHDYFLSIFKQLISLNILTTKISVDFILTSKIL